MQKFVILDRDGVINHDSEHYIKTPAEWIPIDGSLEAIALLKQAGFTVVIVTNQSGVGRGLYSEENLNRIHDKLHALLQQRGVDVDRIYVCPHAPDAKCHCRKPGLGLFQDIQRDYHIDLSQSYFVFDKYSDLQAGLAIKSYCLWVETGFGRAHMQQFGIPEHVHVVSHLLQAAHFILEDISLSQTKPV